MSLVGWVVSAALAAPGGSTRGDREAPSDDTVRPVTIVSVGVGPHVGGVGFGFERRVAASWLVRGAVGAFALDGPAGISVGGGGSWLSTSRAPNHLELGVSVGPIFGDGGALFGVASLVGYRHLPARGGFDFRVGGGPAVLLVSAAGVPQGHPFLPELEVGWSF